MLDMVPVRSALDVPLTARKVPATTAAPVRILIALSLIVLASFSGADTAAPSQWFSWLALYISCIYPTVAAEIPGIGWVDIDPAAITSLMDAYPGNVRDLFTDAAKQAADMTSITGQDQTRHTALAAAITAFAVACNLPSPALGSHLLTRVSLFLGSLEIQAHLSIVVYLSGKHYTAARAAGGASNIATYHIARPTAIQNRSFGGLSLVSLSGVLKMSESAVEAISETWKRQTAMRSVCLQQFATLKSIRASEGGDVFYTTFALLEYADLHSYLIIRKFLDSYSFALAIPAIAGEFGYYLSCVNAISAIPAVYRPLYKAMLADRTKLFKRDELKTLLGLAVVVLTPAFPRIADFAHTPPAPAILAEFNQRKAIADAQA